MRDAGMYNRYVPDGNGAFRRTVVGGEPQPAPFRPAPPQPPAPPPRRDAPDEGDLLLLLVFALLLADCSDRERPALLLAAAVFLFS